MHSSLYTSDAATCALQSPVYLVRFTSASLAPIKFTTRLANVISKVLSYKC